MSRHEDGPRVRGTSLRQRGLNPRARGESPRCNATHPRATAEPGSYRRAKDAHAAAVTVARAATVAVWRGDPEPTTSRAATIYLERSRLAGGPRPSLTGEGARSPENRRTLRGWCIGRRAELWAVAVACSGASAGAAGPLLSPWESEAAMFDPGYLGPESDDEPP